MKHIKRFIYCWLYAYYDWRMSSAGEAVEMASLDEDHDAMEYWDRRYAKYLEKSEKYYAKIEELDF